MCIDWLNGHLWTQDSKSHHERELKAAEAEVERSRKAAEDIVTEAGTQQQTMETLKLEVEELGMAIAAQQEQVLTLVSLAIVISLEHYNKLYDTYSNMYH